MITMEGSTSRAKLVVDTNVLVTTINRKNPEFAIYEAFEKKAFDWIVSNGICGTADGFLFGSYGKSGA